MTNLLKNNFIYLSVTSIGNKLFFFIVAMLVGRYLGIVELGKYSFALSFVMMFSVFVDMGIFTVSVRDLSQEPKNAPMYLGNLIVLKSIISIGIIVIGSCLTYILPWSQDTFLICFLFFFFIVIDSLSFVLRMVFRSHESFWYEMVSDLGGKLLSISLVVMVIFNHGNLYYVVSSLIIGGIGTFVLGFYFIQRRFFIIYLRFDYSFCRSILVRSSPLVVSWLFISIYNNIDKILIKYFWGNEELGQYSISLLLSNILQMLPIVFSGLLLPRMCWYYEKDRNILENFMSVMLKASLALSFLSAGFFYCYSVYFCSIFFRLQGTPLLNASVCLRILAWAQIPIFLYTIMNNLFICANAQRTLALLSSWTCIISLLLFPVMIRFLGIFGAAFAYLILHVALLIITFLSIDRHLLTVRNAFELKKFVPASFCAILTFIAIKSYTIHGAYILSLFTYFCLLYIMRFISDSDFVLVQKFIHSEG